MRITVAPASVDGDDCNDHGQGDHYLEHGGPIGPVESSSWGDIIPPIAGVHDGLNWTDEGALLYSAGCSAATAGTDPVPVTQRLIDEPPPETAPTSTASSDSPSTTQR